MTFRDFDLKRDLDAVTRIWLECGWIDQSQAPWLKDFFGVGDALVATIDDEAECAVHSTPGAMNYLGETLQLGAVTAVTTSRVARKTGFARQLTARLLARQAEQGCDISALGMFDQGFYDKVGFGSGSYAHWITFDPATLNVEAEFRPPKRLTPKDYKAVHAALLARRKHHGGCSLDPAQIMRAELNWIENPFGLGYFDGPGGTLSHFIIGEAAGEHGPYTITLKAYENHTQLMELLGLIRSLGDQVNSIGMMEFADIQLQDLLRQPMRHRRLTADSKFAAISKSIAYWQARILNLESCLAKTHLPGPPVTFNLNLSDPVSDSLDAGSNWQGIAGQYIVTLGAESSAEDGVREDLPTLTASVNAFTRMWLGVRPATSLSATADLTGPSSLLAALDACVCIPQPHFEWDF